MYEGIIQDVRSRGAMVAGSEDLDAAMSRIFEVEGAVDEDLRTSVIPIVEIDPEAVREQRRGQPEIAGTS